MTIARVDIRVGHVLERLAELPEKSVHACVTSPPYWGLRDYKTEPVEWADGPGKLGLEPTLEQFIGHLVEVLAAVKRVLRDDGTCWVNLGDSYSNQGGHTGQGATSQRKGRSNIAAQNHSRQVVANGIDAGNLCFQPARFALAMQAKGWVLRSRIIWAKGLSFCDEYAGSVMPESVNGWRWERCRVKVRGVRLSKLDRKSADHDNPTVQGLNCRVYGSDDEAQWSDCPGCEKCEPNGGYVLRQGSWRPTSAYEEILLFAKQGCRYYADGDAVREAGACESWNSSVGFNADGQERRHGGLLGRIGQRDDKEQSGRNLRNVWAINPQPFPDAHFATFPEALVEPIIKAATSEKGVCPECGAPWARVVKRSCESLQAGDGWKDGAITHANSRPGSFDPRSTTLGWRPTCGCGPPEAAGWTATKPNADPTTWVRPATVLDPFGGSGTTGLVARKLGRHAILIELNPTYAEMARRRVDAYAPLFSGLDGG